MLVNTNYAEGLGRGPKMIKHQELSERQKQIIDEAIKLIAKKGLHEFTTKNLAQSVGISEPAIYRHFKNKDAIMLGLIKYLNNKSQEVIDAISFIKNKSASETIELKFLSMMQFFSKNNIFAKTSGNPGMFIHDKVLKDEISKFENKLFKNDHDLVERGQKEGDIRTDLDSQYLTKIIIGMHFATIHRWIISGTNYDLLDEWANVWGIIKKMILVKK